jgi:chloride channel 7
MDHKNHYKQKDETTTMASAAEAAEEKKEPLHEDGEEQLPPPPPSHNRSGQLRVPGMAPEPKKVSSLDFERVVNQYSIQAIRDRMFVPLEEGEDEDNDNEDHEALIHKGNKGDLYSTFQSSNTLQHHRYKYKPKPKIYGYTGQTSTRWILTLMTGLMMGLTAILIVSCTESIMVWRSEQLDRLWADPQVFVNKQKLAGFYILLNLFLALVSAFLCLHFSPQAAGSGVPEVISYLNGVRVYKFSSVPLFLVKIVATVLSVSSGLVCGPEGPFIHIGAMLGAFCTKIVGFLQNSLREMDCRRSSFKYTLYSWINIDLVHFSNDAERRDLVGIGAAAGFSAAFGAPIGGLLFSLEEASSFFSHSMFLKTLSATSLATFCLAVHHGDLSRYSVISLGGFHSPDSNIFLNRFVEVPLYILIGAAGGAGGGTFVLLWKKMQQAKQRFFKNMTPGKKMRIQLAEVAVLSMLTSFVTFYLSTRTWACKDIDLSDDIIKDKNAVWSSQEHGVLCGPNQVNEMAAILFGGRDEPIRAILTDPTQFDERTLLWVGLSFLPLMTLTLGVALPSGIFMPSILIGCSLGGYMGIQFQRWFSHDLSPSTFALLGAAALLAGIQRSTVSLCVILVEGTGQVKVLIPVIITVVVARYVGDQIIKEGLYEAAMELNHYPFLEHEEKKRYDVYQVSHIMSTSPCVLGPRERAHTVAKILEDTTHNGFPVVDKKSGGKFLGLVRRDQLVALLECGVFMTDEEEKEYESFRNGDLTTVTDWTPNPGITKTPLMNLAYHIKDDRYQYITEGSTSNLDEEFDQDRWVQSLFKSVKNLDAEGLPAAVTEHVQTSIRGVQGSRKTRYGWVGQSRTGQIAVRINPSYSKKWVHIAAVMNRGTYTVTEFCPVSKAMRLFTALGLRHLVVLGGETGGSVVGVVTRANLLSSHIESLHGAPAGRLPDKL